MTTKFKKDNSFFYTIHNGLITDNLADSMDDLICIQEKLFDFGLTMSGFQFVGLVLENSITSKPVYLKVAYFILSLGFVLSLFGCFISYITFKYFRSIKNEKMEFIEEGLIKYNNIFMLSYVIPFCNSALFLVPINILIYNILDVYFAVSFNVFSITMFIVGFVLHQIVIVNKQVYKIKREQASDLELTNMDASNEIIIQRRFSNYLDEQKKED